MHLGGGELTQWVLHGRAATSPVTGRMGFKFDGWDQQFDNIVSDMTITARWTPVTARLPSIPQQSEQIISVEDLALFHFYGSILYAIDFDLAYGSEMQMSDFAWYCSGVIQELLALPSIMEKYPDRRMPAEDFYRLLREVCGYGDDYSTIAGSSEIGNVLRIENDYVYWGRGELSALDISLDVTAEENYYTILATFHLSDGDKYRSTIWGWRESTNIFVPYELLSVTIELPGT